MGRPVSLSYRRKVCLVPSRPGCLQNPVNSQGQRAHLIVTRGLWISLFRAGSKKRLQLQFLHDQFPRLGLSRRCPPLHRILHLKRLPAELAVICRNPLLT
jgi:hypothetical protein